MPASPDGNDLKGAAERPDETSRRIVRASLRGERCVLPQDSVALRAGVAKRRVFAHHCHAFPQAHQPGHFERAGGEVDGRLAETAIADARIVMHRFQRVPVLATLAIQATLLDVDAQSGDPAPDRSQEAAIAPTTLHVRTR